MAWCRFEPCMGHSFWFELILKIKVWDMLLRRSPEGKRLWRWKGGRTMLMPNLQAVYSAIFLISCGIKKWSVWKRTIVFCRTWLSHRDSFAAGKTSPRLEHLIWLSESRSFTLGMEKGDTAISSDALLTWKCISFFFFFSFSPSFNGRRKALLSTNVCNCPVTFARSPSEHRKLGKHFSQGNWWFFVLVLFLQGQVTYGKSCCFRINQSYSSSEHSDKAKLFVRSSLLYAGKSCPAPPVGNLPGL